MMPLTRVRPKALLPFAQGTLVDQAVARVRSATSRIAVNVHHGRGHVEEHLSARVHLSVEPELLGTAGAVGNLAPWVAQDDLVVVNADTWCPVDLSPVVDGWDRERVRVVVHGEDDLTPHSRIVASLYPSAVVHALAPEPSGLYEVCWAPRHARGHLDVVRSDGPFVDCATPRSYLTACLTAGSGRSQIGSGAVVEGTTVRSVVWPGARVWPGEVVVDGIRTDAGITVLVR